MSCNIMKPENSPLSRFRNVKKKHKYNKNIHKTNRTRESRSIWQSRVIKEPSWILIHYKAVDRKEHGDCWHRTRVRKNTNILLSQPQSKTISCFNNVPLRHKSHALDSTVNSKAQTRDVHFKSRLFIKVFIMCRSI